MLAGVVEDHVAAPQVMAVREAVATAGPTPTGRVPRRTPVEAVEAVEATPPTAAPVEPVSSSSDTEHNKNSPYHEITLQHDNGNNATVSARR